MYPQACTQSSGFWLKVVKQTWRPSPATSDCFQRGVKKMLTLESMDQHHTTRRLPSANHSARGFGPDWVPNPAGGKESRIVGDINIGKQGIPCVAESWKRIPLQQNKYRGMVSPLSHSVFLFQSGSAIAIGMERRNGFHQDG